MDDLKKVDSVLGGIPTGNGTEHCESSEFDPQGSHDKAGESVEVFAIVSRVHAEEIVDPAAEKQAAARSSDKNRPARPSKVRPEGWEPFSNAPEKVQRRFRGQLDRAHREPSTAIKLNCIECMGYSESEPRRCVTRTCPLFAFNRRIFGDG